MKPLLMNVSRTRISVVFVVGGLPYGGIEIGLLDLLTHLDAERFDARVVNLSGQGMLTRRYMEQGVTVINMGVRLSTHRLDTTWCLRRLFVQLNPEVIVTAHFSANYHARLAALGLRSKVITYVHNLKSERYWERKLADHILGSIGTHRFLAVSRKVQEVLERRVPAAVGKTLLLYNAVSLERLTFPAGYSRERFREREGIHAADFLITAIGRTVYQKGFDLLLTAFARLCPVVPEARLLIAGDGAMLHELEKMIAQLRLSERVRLLGYRADVASLLGASDLFALPSRWEGFGVVALEAMALGVPMVMTETSPNAEVLVHGETGWIVQCDPEDIAEGILALYRNATLRRKLSCQAQALFAREFTMQAYVQKVSRIIDQTAMT